MKILRNIFLAAATGAFCLGSFTAPVRSGRTTFAASPSAMHFDAATRASDPDFTARFDYFSAEEVPSLGKLDKRTRYIAIQAALLGCQGVDEYRSVLDAALADGFSPVEAKEIVYQATAYLGIGRTKPFLLASNEVMQKRGISLPLPSQETTTLKDRREKGTAKQVELFGPHMEDSWKQSNIRYMLAANCFGDYYTRGGLSNSDRVLVMFCVTAAQGGCETQLASHAKANIKLGNSAEFLENVITEIQPYIGYPRSLNALAVVNKARNPDNK